MNKTRIRMTVTVLDVLSLLAEAPPGKREWGKSICDKTGYGTGTVYPVLERLLRTGMVTAAWEEPAPADRPRRRYYGLSASGHNALQDEIRARHQRRTVWLAPHTTGTNGDAA